MTDLTNLRTDPARESRGVRRFWRDGIHLVIGSLGNPAYDRDRRECIRRAGDVLRELDPTSPEVLDVVAPAIARHILLGWDGITENGAPLPYSVAKATELLTDPGLRHLRAFVLQAADDVNAYLASQAASAEGD